MNPKDSLAFRGVAVGLLGFLSATRDSGAVIVSSQWNAGVYLFSFCFVICFLCLLFRFGNGLDDSRLSRSEGVASLAQVAVWVCCVLCTLLPQA